MDKIVLVQLRGLQDRLLEDRDIDLQVDDLAVDWLASASYDKAYGARPLRRVIQRKLLSPLAHGLLAGEILDGAPVQVTVLNDELAISQNPAVP